MFLSDEYTEVKLNSLKIGMEIDFEIYHKVHNNYVLLCKNVLITEELLAKFFKLVYPDPHIYVPEKRLNFFASVPQKQSEPPKTHAAPPVKKVQKKFTFEKNELIKEETITLFQAIGESSKVPEAITAEIADTVHNQVNTVDATMIVQSINSLREADDYLYTHSSNVALLNGLMGRWLKWDDAHVNKLIKVGVLHDVGKLKIPPEILNKPGALTDDEFNIIKKHPVYSLEILVASGVKDYDILSGVVQHHERVNGGGYPQGVDINKITEIAKVTAISDVYDAMVAKRCYKDPHSPFEILDWFAQGGYSDLDIYYVNLFIDCMLDELKNKEVILSDGRVGRVVYAHRSNIRYPMVEIDGTTVSTSSELECVSMY